MQTRRDVFAKGLGVALAVAAPSVLKRAQPQTGRRRARFRHVPGAFLHRSRIVGAVRSICVGLRGDARCLRSLLRGVSCSGNRCRGSRYDRGSLLRMITKENASEIQGWSRRQFEHYVREPFWRSAPFLLLAALLVIDVLQGVVLAHSSWVVFGFRVRFLLLFLVATCPLILYGAVQQQRLVRRSALPVDVARRILALTFAIATWSYALIGIALQLLRLVARNA
jgi:hypothetical protein